MLAADTCRKWLNFDMEYQVTQKLDWDQIMAHCTIKGHIPKNEVSSKLEEKYEDVDILGNFIW